jgi:uncharacterized protein (DUF362 family)
MDRREFVKALLSSTSALALGTRAWPAPLPAVGNGSRVVLVRNTALADLGDEALHTAVANMVHFAVRDAVGTSTPQQAWSRLFKPEDVVAVKVNCLAPELSPSPGVILAIAQGLASAGVPQENIIIYDKEDRDLAKAGYTLRGKGPGVLCYGTAGETVGPGYEERFTLIGNTSFRLSKIVTRTATAIINVPVVKQHEYAGITGALKNHFGSIHNPEDFHKFACDPAVSDVNQATAIRSKQRLIIADALRVLYNGGPSFAPQYVVPYWAVFVSTDPVALDAELLQLIELCRQRKDLPPLSEQEYTPKHIQTAAQAGLGIADLQRIDLRVHNFG